MGMTYTDEGNQLIIDAINEGSKITFSRVELVADPERSGGELTQEIDIVMQEVIDEQTIRLRAKTDNYGFTEDYYFNRINVYAEKETEDVLYCFQESNNCPFYIPAYDGRPVQTEIAIYIIVTSSDAVEITTDGVYVLRTDFDAAMARKVGVDQIVQNTVTTDTNKVVSAAVAKNLQDQITQQNTNIRRNVSVNTNLVTASDIVFYKRGNIALLCGNVNIKNAGQSQNIATLQDNIATGTAYFPVAGYSGKCGEGQIEKNLLKISVPAAGYYRFSCWYITF